MIQSRLFGITPAVAPVLPQQEGAQLQSGSQDQAEGQLGGSRDRGLGIPSAGVRVVELFAGVGGFRLGLERAGGFETVWWNQWEPSTKAQHAHEVYARHWPAVPLSNSDITTVPASEVPDHDLLVGGFPCQDYSVASTLKVSLGIEGKKGVLFWDIRRIAEEKRPRHIMLENVDRLLISPAKQRGRDFSIMLCCFRDLGYAVQWRIVKASEYGAAQARKRVFLWATRDLEHVAALRAARDPVDVGVLGDAFPAEATLVRGEFEIPASVGDVSDRFSARYLAAGIMVDGRVVTTGCKSKGAPPRSLGSVLSICEDRSRFLSKESIEAPRGWRYVKGAKNEQRSTDEGFGYRYKEGALSFPDRLDRPGRTMLTDEGSTAPGRGRHVVADPGSGELRALQPVEAERLQGFPDGWTEGVPDNRRFFLMGNALVVDMVERMGLALKRSMQPRARDPVLEETPVEVA